MQDTPKVTSEVTPQSMYVEYYTHSFLITLLFMNWNCLFKLIRKLPVQALNGFPLSIYRGNRRKKLI